jgi:hypothetical protein
MQLLPLGIWHNLARESLDRLKLYLMRHRNEVSLAGQEHE